MMVTMQCRAGHGVALPYREITCSGRYNQRDAKGEGNWKVDLHAWWGVKHEGWIPDAEK
jgi:hypothetical protein